MVLYFFRMFYNPYYRWNIVYVKGEYYEIYTYSNGNK